VVEQHITHYYPLSSRAIRHGRCKGGGADPARPHWKAELFTWDAGRHPGKRRGAVIGWETVGHYPHSAFRLCALVPNDLTAEALADAAANCSLARCKTLADTNK